MLTVLMATHCGENTLPRVLEACCELEPPRGGWKLLAVDNGSTDATREVLHSFAGRLPLTYLFEAQRGQNRARNAGLLAIDGDLVVFADDDAIPRRDWLARIRSAADAHPEFSIFGGAILPRWEKPPEDWVLRWVHPGLCFALTDPNFEEGPIDSDFVHSPNMAIRADVFRSGYTFDESFGPREGSYPMGSETDLMRRLSRAGLSAWHVKSAVVEHIIRPSQLTEEWLLGRAMRYGRGIYRLTWGHQEQPAWDVVGVPVFVLRSILSDGLHLAVAKWNGDQEEMFRRGWSLRYSIGRAIEAFVIQRERGTR